MQALRLTRRAGFSLPAVINQVRPRIGPAAAWLPSQRSSLTSARFTDRGLLFALMELFP